MNKHDYEVDYEVEKYVVQYGANLEKVFFNVEEAVEFARKKHKAGYLVSIKQINNIIGWWYI